MKAAQDTTDHATRTIRNTARVLVTIWAGWILVERGVFYYTTLHLGGGSEGLLFSTGFWLIFLISAAIPWRWEHAGSIVLLLEGTFLLLLFGFADTSVLLKALLPLVAGCLFSASWRARTPEGLNRVALFKMIFNIFSHLFIFASVFLIATKAKPLYTPFSIVYLTTVALLGYLSILCVIQSVLHILRKGLSFLRILLLLGCSLACLFMMYVVYVASFTLMATPTEYVNYIVVIVTALTGLMTAISGIVAQMTIRKKTLAEIEIENKKLDLEREKLQLEKEKLASSIQHTKSKKVKSS